MSELLIENLLLLLVLCLVAAAYLRMADKLNIIDKPNQRSSHTSITVRGGGVIFPVSLLLYSVIHGFPYLFFIAGLTLIAVISFADDLKHQSRKLRLAVHFAAVSLLLFQVNEMSLPYWLLPILFVLSIGVINAYNFMDGINGITSGYAIIMLLTLISLHQEVSFIDVQYLYALLTGALVFAYMNFRKKALCFAGDVGSVSMAFSLIFPVMLLIFTTGNPLFILLFGVYGVDTVLTIVYRLMKRENIFEAHRQHLFQYLANEAQWLHVAVSALYMSIQLLLNAGIYFVWKNGDATTQCWFAIASMLLLGAVHTFVKFSIIRRQQIGA